MHYQIALASRIIELNDLYYDGPEADKPTMDDMTACMSKLIKLTDPSLHDLEFITACNSVIDGYYSDSTYDEINNAVWDFIIAVVLHDAMACSENGGWSPIDDCDRHIDQLNLLKARRDVFYG